MQLLPPDATGAYVIAELGINHGGSVDVARSLIAHAAEAGAHAVKFQYRGARLLERPSQPLEIGHELVAQDLERSKLAANEVVDLARFAKSLELAVGTSLFAIADLYDFPDWKDNFDFFKIPSAELMNRDLTLGLVGKLPLLLSLGGHSEDDIAASLSDLPTDAEWYPMHCVSNYPTVAHNARLGYVSWLKRHWSVPIGYSSHDDDFRRCAVAFALGARIFERHITLSKNSEGLDHSSSSDPEEFAALVQLLKETQVLLMGDEPRAPNQGEILNMQNLGGCFHAVRDIAANEPIALADVEYRPPRLPGSATQPADLPKMLSVSVRSGEAVPSRNQWDDLELLAGTVEWARSREIALPVRPHDLATISNAIPLDRYEFHLSAGDLSDTSWTAALPRARRFSLHLPDYCSVDALLDPLGAVTTTRQQSRTVISNALAAVGVLADRQRDDVPVPVVASFTSPETPWVQFVEAAAGLHEEFSNVGGLLTFQWLPPFAWYFGGSVSIRRLNDVREFDDLSRAGVGLCLDLAHASMSARFRDSNLSDLVVGLLPLTKHIHISGAAGVDGEGVELERADEQLISLLPRVIETQGVMKVLESWQGHLGNYRGFKRDLRFLERVDT